MNWQKYVSTGEATDWKVSKKRWWFCDQDSIIPLIESYFLHFQVCSFLNLSLIQFQIKTFYPLSFFLVSVYELTDIPIDGQLMSRLSHIET